LLHNKGKDNLYGKGTGHNALFVLGKFAEPMEQLFETLFMRQTFEGHGYKQHIGAELFRLCEV